MFYYRWLRFPQYSVVYNKQLKLTVPTVHCFSVSRHVQCIWLAQLLLNTILYLCLKMSESDQNGSFKDINALQSYNLFVSQPPQQGNKGRFPMKGNKDWRIPKNCCDGEENVDCLQIYWFGEQTSSNGFLQSTSFYNCCCLHFATQSNEQWSTFLGFNCSKICLSCHHLLSFTYLKRLT